MKALFLTLSLVASPALASEGFFACTTHTGLVITASLNGEALVENARAHRAGEAQEPQTLESTEVNLTRQFSVKLLDRMPEESVAYTIRAKKIRGVSEASVEIRAGDTVVTEQGVCVVKFRAGI